MERRLRNFLIAVYLGTTFFGQSSVAAPAPPQEFVYAVHHSRYGRIGTYRNTIVHDGDEIAVNSELRIAVSFLGIAAFRQKASRQELWKDGRLVSFHGVTSTNGKSIELSGATDGDRFVLRTPNGETAAPADVRLANPWTPGILFGHSMFTLDRGRLDEVRVTGGQLSAVNVDGQKIQAKVYDVYLLDGQKKYEVDFDKHGTPVQFMMFISDGTVTFSLAG
jgi:Family of unknown function (DUF6134)